MEPPLHYYSRPFLLSTLKASTSPAPAVEPRSITTEAWAAAPADAVPALAWLKNTDAVVVLALLVCGLLAAIALHVVLRCALRATARAWHRHGTSAQLLTEPGRARAGRKELPWLQAYSAGQLLELSLAGPECAICLAEFAGGGEQVRVLPPRLPPFHAGCIDRWLAARPTFPTCRRLAAVAPELEHVPVDCTSRLSSQMIDDGVRDGRLD